MKYHDWHRTMLWRIVLILLKSLYTSLQISFIIIIQFVKISKCCFPLWWMFKHWPMHIHRGKKIHRWKKGQQWWMDVNTDRDKLKMWQDYKAQAEWREWERESITHKKLEERENRCTKINWIKFVRFSAKSQGDTVHLIQRAGQRKARVLG